MHTAEWLIIALMIKEICSECDFIYLGPIYRMTSQRMGVMPQWLKETSSERKVVSSRLTESTIESRQDLGNVSRLKATRKLTQKSSATGIAQTSIIRKMDVKTKARRSKALNLSAAKSKPYSPIRRSQDQLFFDTNAETLVNDLWNWSANFELLGRGGVQHQVTHTRGIKQ